MDSLKKYFRTDLKIEDVALYILQLLSQNESKVSAMKLQKICFYVQGWYVAKKDTPCLNMIFKLGDMAQFPQLYISIILKMLRYP